ncbi:MAG: amidase [Sphingorhabdus sp.]
MTASPADRSIFLTGPFPGKGMRVVFKDCIDIAGEITTAGSRALADQPHAQRDAVVVARFKAAGCAITGRVTMHELAYGVTGFNEWTGTPINPAYPLLIPGGSSSGSAAAVAAHAAEIGIGTDTGGSIRVPAACCGVIGLKPTFGRVSREGLIPKGSSLDCVGPLARSMTELEEAMAILVPDWQRVECAPSARIAFLPLAREQAIIRIALTAARSSNSVTLSSLPAMDAAQRAGLQIIGRECFEAFEPLIKSGLVGRDVQERLLAAQDISDIDLVGAETVRSQFCDYVDRMLGEYDAIALPTLPSRPPALHDAVNGASAISITANCRPFNLSGHPAIALPVGEYSGAPVSLQLVGRKGEDEKLCALARTIPLYMKGKTA